MACVRALGAQIVACAALVDRSGGTLEFGVPFQALLAMPVQSYAPDSCKMCAQGLPVEKPGSRALLA